MSGSKIFTFHFSLFLFMLTSCSYIGEDERYIKVEPVGQDSITTDTVGKMEMRRVLLEDFTGQRCVNCPNASDVITGLQESFGADTVIAVAIHAGPLAFYTNSKFLGLRTQTGDEYYSHWQLEYQPVGLVNRSAPTEYQEWTAKVREELQKTSSVTISLSGQISADRTSLTVNTAVTGLEGTASGYLQLWLTEDDITAFQLMPDGTRKDDYLHHHVFRAAVNGLWGQEILVEEGQTVNTAHTMPIDREWNPERLAVVAFIYNDEGVLQVRQFNIFDNETQNEPPNANP
ncbi:MAG: Omp28 family outer membrane lipoprotein [Bacteroidaceae bacterium]|nr:Omp28 family outer membrane lipoprotein [Bacteroidaceae bacterium]